MEPYLKDIEVWCWRYKENTRNYPGLHFTAKPEACDALFTCLQQLRREGSGAYRTIPLRVLQEQDAAKISGGLRYESFSRLRMTLHEESDHLRQMSFRVENGVVQFDFIEGCLTEFELGLTDVRNGTGDYCIRPRDDRKDGRHYGDLDRKSECLWFWPCFGHLSVE